MAGCSVQPTNSPPPTIQMHKFSSIWDFVSIVLLIAIGAACHNYYAFVENEILHLHCIWSSGGARTSADESDDSTGFGGGTLRAITKACR